MINNADLLHSIYANAERNLTRNQAYSLEEAKELSQEYISACGSSIAKDVLCLKDLDKAKVQLIKEVIELAYISSVMVHYIQEIERQDECQENELIEEITNEQRTNQN